MQLRLLRHGTVDSTNERALAAVAEGRARHGDVHVATHQTAGRGRRGRTWESPADEGLYLTLVLLPERPLRPPALTMGAGLAVLEAARTLGAGRARLKWPNDLLVPGEGGPEAKLAGILVEARGADPGRPHAVIGIGINVLQTEFPAPLEAERAVTSLRRLGLAVTLESTLDALLEGLAPRMQAALERPEAVARDYAEALGLVGRAVRVVLATGERRGRLDGLALDGLRLATSGGEERLALEHVQALEAAPESS